MVDTFFVLCIDATGIGNIRRLHTSASLFRLDQRSFRSSVLGRREGAGIRWRQNKHQRGCYRPGAPTRRIGKPYHGAPHT